MIEMVIIACLIAEPQTCRHYRRPSPGGLYACLTDGPRAAAILSTDHLGPGWRRADRVPDRTAGETRLTDVGDVIASGRRIPCVCPLQHPLVDLTTGDVIRVAHDTDGRDVVATTTRAGLRVSRIHCRLCRRRWRRIG